jgi:hypothetical protein
MRGLGKVSDMRKIVAAAAFAIAFAGVAPAYAQFGGSPDLQTDGEYDQFGDEYDDDKFAYGEGGPAEEYGGKDEWSDADAYADQGYADQDYADQGYADQGYADQDYVDQGYADQGYPQQSYRGETWQGNDGRAYCRRSDGTTGLVVGAGAGALVGRGIDTRGERGTGTILGAIAGALLGAAVERGASCR